MISSRLRKQGYVNLHRKLIFRLLAAGLVSYLIFAPDLLKLPALAVISGQIAGSLLVFLGIMGRVVATISIGGNKDREIVKTEAYSICRNPLYFSSFLMALGVGLLSGRPDFMMLTASSFLAIFCPMMLNEAGFLRSKFDDFAEYERKVPLFFPNIMLWNERKYFEINFRLVRRTLLDASIMLLAIPIMILMREFR